jgi:hypothetical protein
LRGGGSHNSLQGGGGQYNPQLQNDLKQWVLAYGK